MSFPRNCSGTKVELTNIFAMRCKRANPSALWNPAVTPSGAVVTICISFSIAIAIAIFVFLLVLFPKLYIDLVMLRRDDEADQLLIDGKRLCDALALIHEDGQMYAVVLHER